MAYQVIYSPFGQPTQYSVTNWNALGNGMWSNDPASYGRATGYIPKGYRFDTVAGGLVKDSVASDLEPKTIQVLNESRVSATANNDKSKVRLIDLILGYGTQIVELAAKTAAIFNPTKPLTLDNMDSSQIEKDIAAGKYSVPTGLSLSDFQKQSAPVSNSTYFGIDFSKPLNIILVVLALWAVYQIIQQVSNPKPATVQPVQQLNAGYGRGRQRLRLAA